MKKFFFSSPLTAAVLTALTFAACSDSDTIADGNSVNVVNTADNAIQFGTYLGTQNTRAYTKGVITNAESGDYALRTAKFGVFAYYTGNSDYVISTPTDVIPNFMYNQEIQWGSTLSTPQWIYSPVKYWPNGTDADNILDPSYTATQEESGKVSFFAFAPYTSATNNNYSQSTDGEKPSAIGSGTTNDEKVKKTANTTSGVAAITANDWNGNVWVKYLMPNATETEAVDLLWGMNGKSTYNETDGVDPAVGAIGTGYNINLTKQTVDEKVKFLFKHALAKVGGSTATTTTDVDAASTKCGFMVVVDVDANDADKQSTYFGTDFDNTKTLVTIEKVEIMDGASAAAASPAMAETGTKSNFNTFGWFNIETGAWCTDNGTYGNNGDGATYSITADKDETTIDADNVYAINKDIREATVSNPTGTWNTTTSGGATGVTTTPKPLFANEYVPALLVIPGGENNNTLYVRIKYWVRTADQNLKDGYTNVSQTITNRISLGNLLDPNKYYTIVMHLGLTSVKFEAVVTDWTMTSDATFDDNGTVHEGDNKNDSKIWLPSNVVADNQWTLTPSATNYAAKGGDITMTTIQMNGNNLEYDNSSASEGKYTLTKVGTADWLTIGTDGKMTASPNTATATRSATINVSTVVNGNTITTPITFTQAGYKLNLTSSGGATVTVKDGDGEEVTGYSVTVSGGDGNGDKTTSGATITVTGTSGQTYTVTVTNNGATATTTVTI